MPNESLDQATQTEPFVQSATLTQQRDHQENLDQDEDVNQGGAFFDKKTSDESSFLRGAGHSITSQALLIEINERKYQARIDCITKIYVAANRIHSMRQGEHCESNAQSKSPR